MITSINSNLTSKSPRIDPTSITMDHQSILAVPCGLTKIFPNLMHLQIRNSSLIFLQRGCIENVEVLLFPHNEIRKLTIDTFWDCHTLKQLGLSHNKIETLDENLFIYSRHLTYFYANSNKIKTLQRNLFRNNAQLKIVSLNENQLVSIGIEFFRFKSIELVSLLSKNSCINEKMNTTIDDAMVQLKFHQNIAENCFAFSLN